jgi:transcriptional regulator of acetoin/glycerol metabolism
MAPTARTRPTPGIRRTAASTNRLPGVQRFGWNLTRTAKALGIARGTLRGRIQRLGLRRD